MRLTILKQFFHNTTLMFSSSSKLRQIKGDKAGRRWRMFHATDFQSLMYPCFIFCRILGIFPYKINASSFEISKPFYILSTVITCVIGFYTLIVLYVLNNSEWFMIRTLRRTIELNAFYIFGSFIMVVTSVWVGPRMRLLQTILRISSGLPLESYEKQSVLIHAKDIVGFFFLFVQLLFCFYNVQFYVMLKAFSFYITLIVFQMDMLYMNCVCVLKACFKRINDGLANLLVMNDESHLWVHHERRNPFLLMELEALKKQHLIVNDTVQMLNMIFSPQLLATVVITFVRLTFYLYFSLMLWENSVHVHVYMNNLEKQVYYIFLMTSVAFYLIKIALVVWACETGKDQANEIAIIIHNVFNSTNDEQVKVEVIKK
ncbi:PREDICTED: uncharacterized protein LOC105452171 [Wasmannia auropunctata]|uniref:uncharacterized protein LOC105452171 n=1 Tax=Wasmannia auropunctata TaxID=64793 RepID=UPI0005EDDA69|nr:PREDICTED: uncharacterized protein LOC105452171 [Wasmannia auropunctata]